MGMAIPSPPRERADSRRHSRPAYPQGTAGGIIGRAAAEAAWVPAGRDLLAGIASQANATISQSDFADEVQRRGGVHALGQPAGWLAHCLESLAIATHAEGIPPLTSLVVQGDGKVGESYACAATRARARLGRRPIGSSATAGRGRRSRSVGGAPGRPQALAHLPPARPLPGHLPPARRKPLCRSGKRHTARVVSWPCRPRDAATTAPDAAQIA